jgi:tetratricopeptide (TPR) repeat protein
VASALSGLANVTSAAGDNDAALELYEQAATHARRAGARPVLASVMSNLGYVSLLAGDPSSALERCREAAALFEELEVDAESAGAWLNVAAALLMLRRSEEAGPPLARSLARYVKLQHTDGISYCLDAAAALAVQRQELRTAGLLAGAAEAARSRTEGLAPPGERWLHEQALDGIAALGPESAAEARREGAALTLDAAVAAADAVALGTNAGALGRGS